MQIFWKYLFSGGNDAHDKPVLSVLMHVASVLTLGYKKKSIRNHKHHILSQLFSVVYQFNFTLNHHWMILMLIKKILCAPLFERGKCCFKRDISAAHPHRFLPNARCKKIFAKTKKTDHSRNYNIFLRILKMVSREDSLKRFCLFQNHKYWKYGCKPCMYVKSMRMVKDSYIQKKLSENAEILEIKFSVFCFCFDTLRLMNIFLKDAKVNFKHGNSFSRTLSWRIFAFKIINIDLNGLRPCLDLK